MHQAIQGLWFIFATFRYFNTSTWSSWMMPKIVNYENVGKPMNLKPRQNGHHFADDILKCIFLNENVWILITISLKFVPKGPINNILALAQKIAWRRPGDKPLSEPMMASLLTHIWVTRPQWVNKGKYGKMYTSWCYKTKITWWHHEKMMISNYGLFVKAIPWSPVDSLTRASNAELPCFLLLAWTQRHSRYQGVDTS